MAIKTVTHETGQVFKFGYVPSRVRRPGLSASSYFAKDYTPPAFPASRDWRPRAAASLAQMLMNDKLGCCVIAAGGHREGIWTGNVDYPPGIGTPEKIFTDKQIVGDYSAIGGYVEGDPSTDQGCNVDAACDYWVAHGFAGGTKAAGWMRVDASNLILIKGTINEFGTNQVGFAMPDAWLELFQDLTPDTVLDVAGPPNPENGHSVLLVDYQAGPRGKIALSSWARTFWITPAALAAYCVPAAGGELVAMVSREWTWAVSKRSPSNLDWTQLLADMEANRG